VENVSCEDVHLKNVCLPEETSCPFTENVNEIPSNDLFFPFLSRSSMACFYRAMMEELIGSVKQTHSVPLKSTDPPEVVTALISANFA